MQRHRGQSEYEGQAVVWLEQKKWEAAGIDRGYFFFKSLVKHDKKLGFY